MTERELQVIKSKEKIMSTAIEEFALSGYKAASTNIICKKAEVSKGLVYHYYTSKEKLYVAVIKNIIDKFKENVTIKNQDSSKKGTDYMREYFNTKFEFYKENPLYSKIILNVLLNNDIEDVRVLMNDFEDYKNTIIYEVLKNIDINPKFNKEKAFELIIMIGDKLEEKYIKNLQNKDEDKNHVVEKFAEDHELMIQMIFEGIDR
ncbi:MAG: TetR/AcrR family transcriptional regulator [Clostridium sp.]